MNFSVKRNKDSASMFVDALTQAGHTAVKKIDEADFLLFDTESRLSRREAIKQFLKDHPGFIYPHTPLTCWLWDGVYDELPVDCNFVAGSAQKKAMEIYGYKSRVETIGFPRCKVLPFTPTTGRNLLFVPARPRKTGDGQQEKKDLLAWSLITNHEALFDKITILHLGQYDEYESNRIEYVRTDVKVPDPAARMLEYIDQADLVISIHTVAALSVARGKPTVFYGEIYPPDTPLGHTPKRWDEYKHLLRYPLTIEEMTIDEVLATREAANPLVEHWKETNIAGNFNEAKFLGIVEECLHGKNK